MPLESIQIDEEVLARYRRLLTKTSDPEKSIIVNDKENYYSPANMLRRLEEAQRTGKISPRDKKMYESLIKAYKEIPEIVTS
ncbi:MAG: hypothetical protein AABX11_01395 [Nanoarchaeota archaeon]